LIWQQYSKKNDITSLFSIFYYKRMHKISTQLFYLSAKKKSGKLFPDSSRIVTISLSKLTV
ncbi:hypothetical protein, partial [Macellibacteroides fermentans]|uniref:hypothetical protein n=1 Tax=Macellibacteroides fermentans TaxID=879969 RepID=UPI00406C0278